MQSAALHVIANLFIMRTHFNKLRWKNYKHHQPSIIYTPSHHIELRFQKYLAQRIFKVSKGAKIRNQYNQVPQLTQDTNEKLTYSQLYTTNESQEVSPFPAGDHKVQINRRTQRHSKHKTEKHKRSTKEVPPPNGHILLGGLNRFHGANLTLNSDVDQTHT